MIHIDRIMVHEDGPIEDGKYILYWMQQAQRVAYNHALAYAIELANEAKLPLLVYFGLTPSYPDANRRHYAFMCNGLLEVAQELSERRIGFNCFLGSPDKAIEPLLSHAAALVMDKGYMKLPRLWRANVLAKARQLQIPYIATVETDLIVPIEIAHQKEAYAARTLRPHIKRNLDQYATELTTPEAKYPYVLGVNFQAGALFTLNKKSIEHFLNNPDLDQSVRESKHFQGGYLEARTKLMDFLQNKLSHYNDSNDPSKHLTSQMSPYLHFGQISPLEIYLEAKKLSETLAGTGMESYLGYVEQLTVRRELAFNYVYYREGYDQFETMTYPWAYETMERHAKDIRPNLYDLKAFEEGLTYDPYWNAAQKEMVLTGYMHNYMRMYWCKKIIEWTPDYKCAYDYALYLHNKYAIDARDPNTYVGVAWCFGLHDRGWTRREVFGTLRYMNDKGLKRKFNMQGYLDYVASLEHGSNEQLSLF